MCTLFRIRMVSDERTVGGICPGRTLYAVAREVGIQLSCMEDLISAYRMR